LIKRVDICLGVNNYVVWGLIFNVAKIPGRFLHTQRLFDFVPIIVAGLNFLILFWFALRFIQREKIYARLSSAIAHGEENSWSYIFKFYGHSIDAIALSLLISPSAWEHHYVIAIPIALWAIMTRGFYQSWLVGAGIFLAFCVPTFEIFPLSFHRLVGLLALVYVTKPAFVQSYFLKKSYACVK